MRLLDRYLLRELLTPLGYCLGGFLIFLQSFNLFTSLPELQEHKLHPGEVLEYCAAQTPGYLVLVLPVALLLALLYTLTQLARHQEITAMRAAGLSLWRICRPYFAMGLLASGVLFTLNETVVPHSTQWAQRILTRHVTTPEDARRESAAQKIGVFNEQAHRLWMIRQYNPRTAEMSGLKVFSDLADGSIRTLMAARAVRTNGVWTFFDVSVWLKTDPQTPGEGRKLLQTNVLAVPEFEETPRQIMGEIKMGNNAIVDARTATIPLGEILEYLRRKPHLQKQKASDLRTNFYGRLAAPWTCLVVVLIAIPFGAGSGRRNLFFGVAGSIFIVAGYLVLQQVSLQVGAHGQLPAWLAAWLPNLLFGTMGLLLTTRVR